MAHAMTAGSGLVSPPMKLPKLTPTAMPTAPVAGAANQAQKPPVAPRRGAGPVAVGGADEKETAAKLERRSLMPSTRTGSTAGDKLVHVMRGTPPIVRGPRLRRRSGDFSLPVRYKYVVIPGNNSRAVLAAFRRRPWWGPARKEEDPSAATVVRSSFVSRRKKSAKKSAPGSKLGYSNKTFHLWWEMYASRSVIEGTNLDANLRQAVNHFEFNNTLVSKKGLWRSLRAYCNSQGIPVTSVVPQTFFLSGSAVGSSTTPSSRTTPSGSSSKHKRDANGDDRSSSSSSSSSRGGGCSGIADDDREEFLTFCAEMDDLSGASSPKMALLRDPPPPPTTPAAMLSVVEGGPSLHGGSAGRSEADARLESPPSPPLSRHPASSLRDGSREAHLQESREKTFSPGDGFKLSGTTDAASGGRKSRNMCTNPTQREITAAQLDGAETETTTTEHLHAEETATSQACQVDRRDVEERFGEESSVAAIKDGTKGISSPEGVCKGSTTGDGQDSGCPSAARVHGGVELKEATEGERSGSGVQSARAVARMPTWVVKPAANSNCGFGIQVCCSLKEVLSVVDAPDNKAGQSGWVVQCYIERPLLIRGRKFDIRLFVLLVADPSTRSWRRHSTSVPRTPKKSASSERSSTGLSLEDCCGQLGKAECTYQNPELQVAEKKRRQAGVGVEAEVAPASGGGYSAVPPPPPCPLRAWCHQDAYVRTSSVRYTNDPSKVKDRFIHLTNNAVQRRSPTYGQDEPGNKLTLQNLQEWLDGDESGHKGSAHGWVEHTLRPRMHELVATSVAAAANAGINKRGRPYAFELLGYDFMVDDDLRVWLIEVNSNPCLEFVCPLLQGMIVRVVEDTLSIALDSVFRPPERHRTAAVAGVEDDSEGSRNGFSRVYPVAG